MHQFGHVYALQQELLYSGRSNWFRAAELWHTARHEGIAMNVSHYTHILRQCVEPTAWEQSLRVLRQMSRDGIRPDVVGVGCALATCADAHRASEVETVFHQFSTKMQMDSVCYLALMKARGAAGRWPEVLSVAHQQEQDGVPFLPYTYDCLLEACNHTNNVEYAFALTEQLYDDGYQLSRNASKHALELCARHDRVDEFERITMNRRLADTTPLTLAR